MIFLTKQIWIRTNLKVMRDVTVLHMHCVGLSNPAVLGLKRGVTVPHALR